MTKKEVKMKSNAPSPQLIDGIGVVEPGEIFPVPEALAKKLEKGLFERVKEKEEIQEEPKPEVEAKPEEKNKKGPGRPPKPENKDKKEGN